MRPSSLRISAEANFFQEKHTCITPTMRAANPADFGIPFQYDPRNFGIGYVETDSKHYVAPLKSTLSSRQQAHHRAKPIAKRVLVLHFTTSPEASYPAIPAHEKLSHRSRSK